MCVSWLLQRALVVIHSLCMEIRCCGLQLAKGGVGLPVCCFCQNRNRDEHILYRVKWNFRAFLYIVHSSGVLFFVQDLVVSIYVLLFAITESFS